MTVVAAPLPEVVPVKRRQLPLAQRVHDSYLRAALVSLEQLAGVAREASLLDARGSVVNYERTAARRDELRADVNRYKAMAQLLRDRGLAK